MKKLFIDIEKLNTGDSIDGLKERLPFEVVDNLLLMASMPEAVLEESFLITDNKRAADYADMHGVGMAVYLNGDNNGDDFPKALYCIESFAEMSAKTIERMYLRAKNLPWEILRTENVIVREITLDDIDRLYEIYSNEDVVKYIENLYESKEEEIRYTMDYILNQYRFYEYGMWIVESVKTGEIIGRAGIFDRVDQEYKEIGFVFAKEYWGMGYAKETLKAIINYAHEEFEIDTLIAHVMSANVRSKRLLESLGFVYESDALVDGNKFERYVMTHPLCN